MCAQCVHRSPIALSRFSLFNKCYLTCRRGCSVVPMGRNTCLDAHAIHAQGACGLIFLLLFLFIQLKRRSKGLAFQRVVYAKQSLVLFGQSRSISKKTRTLTMTGVPLHPNAVLVDQNDVLVDQNDVLVDQIWSTRTTFWSISQVFSFFPGLVGARGRVTPPR